MKFTPILIGVGILLLAFPVWGVPTLTAPSGVSAQVVHVERASDILPLSVHAKDSLSSIAVTERSTEKVAQVEKANYSKIQQKLLQAPAAEKQIMEAQLSQQRQRVLLSVLNRLIVVYQKIDFMITSLDSSLVRLRVLHDNRKGAPVPDFDSRISDLSTRLQDLESQSLRVGTALDQVSSSTDLTANIRGSKVQVSELLGSLRVFLVDYHALASDVLAH